MLIFFPLSLDNVHKTFVNAHKIHVQSERWNSEKAVEESEHMQTSHSTFKMYKHLMMPVL